MHHVARFLLLVHALAPAVLAASHREAPAIAKCPTADTTDVFAFVSYEPGRADKLVVIANWDPMQEAAGAPNYFPFDDNIRYEINIDNDGDALADFTFSVKSNVQYSPHQVTTDDGTQIESSLLYNAPNPIGDPFDPDLGIAEIFLLEFTSPGGTFPAANTTLDSTTFRKPIDNVGQDAFAAGYEGFAQQFEWDFEAFDGAGVVNGKIFLGQRRDPFSAHYDFLFTFDLSGPAAALGQPPQGESDSHFGHNVLAFALELPLSYFTDGGNNPILGVWATTRVPQTRVLNALPTHAGDAVLPPGAGDPWIQVSRLGWPFTNMLLVGVNSKDRFNALGPDTDEVEFEPFLLNPAYAALRGYPSSNRTDLRDAVLFGIPGVNQTPGSGDMLRLDTNAPPTATADQNPLGLLGSPPDPAGFPNGRRPGDDVTDIWLRILQGYYLGGAGPFDASDGVPILATQFSSEFPFLQPPLGQDEEPIAVVLTSSTTPQAGGFVPVADAYVDPGNPDRVATMLPPDDRVFFLVEADVGLSIDSVDRTGEVLEFLLSRSGG